MTPMPNGRNGHSCGLIKNPEQGPQIVVAGGYVDDSVDIYTVNTDSWTEGNAC